MREIHGFDDEKIAEYGEELLEMIGDFQAAT
ncbi:hypothetical protein [Alysiella crassa]